MPSKVYKSLYGWIDAFKNAVRGSNPHRWRSAILSQGIGLERWEGRRLLTSNRPSTRCPQLCR